MEHWTKGSDSIGVYASFMGYDGNKYLVTLSDHADGSFVVKSADGWTPPLVGYKAFETLSAVEQTTLFDTIVDEVSDMSSRDQARQFIDGMTIEDMREYLGDLIEDTLDT